MRDFDKVEILDVLLSYYTFTDDSNYIKSSYLKIIYKDENKETKTNFLLLKNHKKEFITMNILSKLDKDSFIILNSYFKHLITKDTLESKEYLKLLINNI